ncbi:MAG: hypothetical protein EXR72_15820 [Myxococcales bacterium]|nr:hypothetical protein [Myxococcales bacterium]
MAEGSARFERVMELFDALCDVDAAERELRLAVLRSEEPALAEEVSRLLARDGGAPGRLDAAASGIARLADEVVSGSHTLPHASALPGIAPRLLLAPLPAPSSRPARPPASLIGELVGGRWLIEEAIGDGGYGSVYRAREQGGGDVAIKFLHAAALPRDLRRFRREFVAVTRLDHPCCVKVFEEGLHGTRRYIAMEYVPGGDLQRLIGAPDAVLCRCWCSSAALSATCTRAGSSTAI